MIKTLSMLLALVLIFPFPALASEIASDSEPSTITEPSETVPVPTVTEETADIDSIAPYVVASVDYLRIIAGCVVFFTVVVLCVFVYKFFRIFF